MYLRYPPYHIITIHCLFSLFCIQAIVWTVDSGKCTVKAPCPESMETNANAQLCVSWFYAVLRHLEVLCDVYTVHQIFEHWRLQFAVCRRVVHSLHALRPTLLTHSIYPLTHSLYGYHSLTTGRSITGLYPLALHLTTRFDHSIAVQCRLDHSHTPSLARSLTYNPTLVSLFDVSTFDTFAVSFW